MSILGSRLTFYLTSRVASNRPDFTSQKFILFNSSFTCGMKQILPFVDFVTGKLGKVNRLFGF